MIIAGLGNPGDRYQDTRHNVGFMVADLLAQRFGIALKKKSYQALCGQGRIGSQQVLILKPQTFMNLSGASIGSAIQSLGDSPGDLVVIHDEIDLPFGVVRLKSGGGHGGHNGLRHICSVLGSKEFIRVRVGVGRPPGAEDVASYVLRAFSAAEKKELDKVLDFAADAVVSLIDQGLQRAMCSVNGQNILNP
ncbi:MAG: aminoacyl-tRNA hydrolase [Desulfuromonadaceae bacterium]|nr:aminoacyl-tRNA hydrolase [Desulfuromonadaceae bacterium]